jgi:hypothetical protein
MKRILKLVAWLVGTVAALGVFINLWAGSLVKDDGGVGRTTYGPYAWVNPLDVNGNPAKQSTPRGGPVPRADGYVMGHLGNALILPPMPPERPTDVHRRDSAFRNAAIRNCFWPGPKLRTGFFTTDPDDYGLENQMPDTQNTFSTAWFKLPEGASIVIKGRFPHIRHWSFITYTEDGVPRDGIADAEIDPDAGSSNPFRPGVRRDAEPRNYSVSIVNGEPPAQRAPNTIYTRAPATTAIGMHMRNYVPDRGIDWTGGVGVPDVELHLADGKVLKTEEACAATATPQRERQVPLTVTQKAYLGISHLPWMAADHTPARNEAVVTMKRFYNREHAMLTAFFPSWLPSDWLAKDKGGFWSNLNTRYGVSFLSLSYGKVYVAHGKLPKTPRTWNGDPAPLDQDADMRYWSLCTSNAPAAGNIVDCVFDENVRDVLDKDGNYNIVISQAPDRPANATEKCGVSWIEYGNGDGVPGGSPDFVFLLNRHTLVNPNFKHSWFGVKQPGTEAEVLGPYMPTVVNAHAKAKFEALGCPVDLAKLAAMARQ